MRHTTASGGHWQWLAIASLLLLTAGCYPDAAPRELGEGVWSGMDGPEQLVFEFAVTHLGAHATLHVLREGRKVVEKPVRRTLFDRPWLDVWIDDFTHYRGRVDVKRQVIDGQILDSEGRWRALDLKRTVPENVPGLRARPATAIGSPPYTYAQPPDLADGWSTGTPESVGIDRARVADLVGAIVAGEAGLVHSLVVVRSGKLVLEEYFHGYGREDLHTITSCTKSVASLLIGMALDRGLIESVSAPVLDFFPEQRRSAGPGWDRVSLEHLLTMTVGRNHEEWRSTGAIECTDTPYPFVLTEPVSGEHGTRWRYGDRDVNLLAGVLRHATGLHADSFAKTYLFGPLGITTYDWSTGKKNGYPMMHGTLRLPPRDLAKLGALVLDDGRWQGRQVVSADWMRTTTRTRVRTNKPAQFGYLWWQRHLPGDLAGLGPVIYASGWGGQLVCVVPAADAVIVVTGGNQFNGKTDAPLKLLADRLFPALLDS